MPGPASSEKECSLGKIICFKGQWFETRHKPGFSSAIFSYFALSLTLNLEISGRSQNLPSGKSRCLPLSERIYLNKLVTQARSSSNTSS